MAGGKGQRFWPRSTHTRPKQFLSLGGNRSLLQITAERVESLVPPDSIYVVTTASVADLVREQLPALPEANVIVEPAGRDTAAAVGYAFTLLAPANSEAVAVVVPSDHWVSEAEVWARNVADACVVAARGWPVLIGIRPSRPETAFGYVLVGEQLTPAAPEATNVAGGPATVFHRVDRFIEKPGPVLAEALVRENRCLWNSGMFIWKVGTALELIHRHLPATGVILQSITRLTGERGAPPQGSPAWRVRVAELYSRIDPISIDYGVLEKCSGVVVGTGEFGWDDVGGWESLARLKPADAFGNVTRGEVTLVDCERCIVDWTGGPAVLIGLREAVIAGGPGPLLACRRDRLGELKTALRDRAQGSPVPAGSPAPAGPSAEEDTAK